MHSCISKSTVESRREWLLEKFKAAGKLKGNKFQLWQAESHPIELSNGLIANQKLTYIHNNPVEAGFVSSEEHWLYSSAIDYNGGKGLLDIIQLEPLIY